MQQNTNKAPQNKGFTVHVGETYVGYLVINEKNVPAKTLENLQVPTNMAAVLGKAELRPFVEKADSDMSDIDALMGSSESATTEA